MLFCDIIYNMSEITEKGDVYVDFRSLTKYMDDLIKTYDIPSCDCSIYYDGINVFRYKSGYTDYEKRRRIGRRDLYFLHSAAKLVNCVAVMQLAESYKIHLNDKFSDYVDGFEADCSISEFISRYSHTPKLEIELYNYSNTDKLIRKVTGQSLADYAEKNIFSPLKMKSTSYKLTNKNIGRIAKQYSFEKLSGTPVEIKTNVEEIFAKNDGCLITSVDDFALFCETICNFGKSKNKYELLTTHSVKELIGSIIFSETEKEDAYVCVGYNGSLVIIDLKKKISLVYVQHMKNITADRMHMYPELRKTAYECIGADTWSKGYNMFP